MHPIDVGKSVNSNEPVYLIDVCKPVYPNFILLILLFYGSVRK